MARARNIKPSFFKNELLVEMGAFDRLLFIGLWCLADREGRIEDRPKRIKMELFPCDAYDVDEGLDELQRHGFVRRYEAAGVGVISIVNFHKHQTPHGTEKDSELPDEAGVITVHERSDNGYVTGKKRQNNVKPHSNNSGSPLENCAGTVNPPTKNTLNPDSLNPDSLNPELGESAPAAQAPKPTKRATVIPADFYPNDTGVLYAEQRNVNLAVELERFRNNHTAKGTTFKDWQAAWRTWCDKAVEFGRTGSKPAAKPVESFRERDERLARERIAAFAPGAAAKPKLFDSGTVIDAEPVFRRIEA